jgi:hypothetical protein
MKLMVSFIVGGLTLAMAVPAFASCNSDEQEIKRTVTRLQAGGSMGICQMAQQSVRLYQLAASFHRRCVPGSSGQAQALEYERAERDARVTAAAACR